MPTILITGASSGLGLAFTAHYMQQPNTIVHTLDISPLPTSVSPPSETKTTNHTHHILDLTSEPAILSFAASMASTPIDLLIHSAGIRGLVEHLHTSTPGSAAEAETLAAMDAETIERTFRCNTLGPFLLFRALLPSLMLSSQPPPQNENASDAKTPKVIVMASRMGSVGRNEVGKGGGGGYAYRVSKAGLNTLVRGLAVDVPDVVWVLVHPGRVESGLVRYKEEGAIGAGESVRGLLGLVDKWGKADSGRFYDRFGEGIEW